MFLREVVHPASKPADGPLTGEPVEGHVNRLTAADVHEVSQNEYRTASAAVNGRNDP